MLSLVVSRCALFIMSLLGILVDGYLTITHIQDGPVVCRGSYGCDSVQASKYSDVGGVPIAAFGLAMYLTLTLVLLLPVKQRMMLLTLISGAGVAVAAYLVYLQLFVIHALCMWCMASALLITLIFMTLLFTQRKEKLD